MLLYPPDDLITNVLSFQLISVNPGNNTDPANIRIARTGHQSLLLYPERLTYCKLIRHYCFNHMPDLSTNNIFHGLLFLP